MEKYYHSLTCDLFDNPNLEDIFKERFDNVCKYGILSTDMQNKLLNKYNKSYEMSYNGNDKISLAKRYENGIETYAFTSFSSPFSSPTLIISDKGIENSFIKGSEVPGEYMVKDIIETKNIVGILFFNELLKREEYSKLLLDCMQILGMYDIEIPFIDGRTDKEVDTKELIEKAVDNVSRRSK